MKFQVTAFYGGGMDHDDPPPLSVTKISNPFAVDPVRRDELDPVVQEVVDQIEQEIGTVDQGGYGEGDDEVYELDLPDAFESKAEAEQAVKKALAAIEKRMGKWLPPPARNAKGRA